MNESISPLPGSGCICADFDEAIRQTPDKAEAWLQRGIAKGQLGQHKQALSLARQQGNAELAETAQGFLADLEGTA
ncbi:MAG: hypothetical protein GDA35_03290 [Hyphomonadaceae bacterium]|nr:hypothetical protein [Hyphomonadaceae bacterium]